MADCMSLQSGIGGKRTPSIAEAARFSDLKFNQVESKVSDLCLPNEVAVIVVGSYARREASEHSDFDYFIYSPQKSNADYQTIHKQLNTIIKGEGISPPAPAGPFGDGCCHLEGFIKNIGGENEKNSSLTRRLLLLFESKCLFGERHFHQLKAKLINRYISRKMTENGLARFLLNDLIKYYRTVCVDFEYKTVEAGKDWGIRNIKLLFSRKLIYFSGLLVVAETAQRDPLEKRRLIKKLLGMSPIERIEFVCGKRCISAMSSYDKFLTQMADMNFRAMARAVESDRETHTPEFRALKNEAQHFTWALITCLEERYPRSHPIHQAIFF